IDVDDVLIFLRGILRVFDGAVRPEDEPLGVLGDPRVVGRALDGEVERHLEPEAVRRGDETAKTVEAAEIGMDRGVAAFAGPDGIGAAGIAWRRRERIVTPLAVDPANGMDRRQINHVETERADLGKTLGAIVESGALADDAALAAGKHLVPCAEARD